jgi:peptide/nickel transport system substrate-binding protein
MRELRTTSGLRRRRRWTAGVLVLSLVLGACGGGDDDDAATSEDRPQGAPKTGGTLVYGDTSDPRSLLPQHLVPASGHRGAFVYDTLLRLDAEGSWAPHMADMTTDDGTTWTMTIREGIKFTDGTPLDAEAVRFNVELTMDPEMGASLRSTVVGVTAMNVIDDRTLEFVLDKPNGTFPYAFTTLPGMMVSPTAYRGDPEGFGEAPVGAGPFILERWTRDVSSTLVRNPGYWDEGKPYLDQIEVRVIPDSTSRGQSLAAGEIDLAARDVNVEAAVQGNDRVTVVTKNANGAVRVVPNQDRPPFDDLRIREALALAIDLSVVNQTIALGTWEEERLVCPPFSPDQPECLPDLWPEPDPERARQLVEDYEAEHGPLVGGYELLAVTPSARDEAELLQQQWAAVGIDVDTLTLLPGAEYATRLRANDYDIVWHPVLPFTGPPVGYYRAMLTHALGGHHLQGGSDDAALDELMRQAAEAVDEDEQLDAIHEFQRRSAKEFQSVWYAPADFGLVASTEVVLPASYALGGHTTPSDIWLDR